MIFKTTLFIEFHFIVFGNQLIWIESFDVTKTIWQLDFARKYDFATAYTFLLNSDTSLHITLNLVSIKINFCCLSSVCFFQSKLKISGTNVSHVWWKGIWVDQRIRSKSRQHTTVQCEYRLKNSTFTTQNYKFFINFLLNLCLQDEIVRQVLNEMNAIFEQNHKDA